MAHHVVCVCLFVDLHCGLQLRLSLGFLLHFLDEKASLLNVPGSLMIDVFIRQQYASDSNAMIVYLLNEAAHAEGALGNTTGGS